jgi:hypothetical protein
MTGRIESGQLCTVVPVDPRCWKFGTLCCARLRENEYLHIVKSIENGRYQIGNNREFINGWIGPVHIYGNCVMVEP